MAPALQQSVAEEAHAGEAELTARVVSEFGETVLKRQSEIEAGLNSLLAADKSIYQPGQAIHIRTLTLRKPDRLPADGSPITLTAADTKGNKGWAK